METIIYLKNLGLGQGVKSFNKTNLSSIDIFGKENVNIQYFDDIEFLEERLGKDLSNKNAFTDWKICTREEFNAIAIEFTNNYNNLIKEL